MSKRGSVPYFMRQKAARMQGERKVNDYRARNEQNRQQAAQVMTWCAAIALHDLYGVSITEFDSMSKDVMMQVASEYLRKQKYSGERKALADLEAQLGDVMSGYRLPTLAEARSERDLRLIDSQRHAGTLALAVCLVTLQRGWNYGSDKLREVLAEADGNYKQFLQWAVDGRGDDDAKTDGTGQYYAYAKLAEVVKQLTGDSDIAVEVKRGAKPVFVENL